MRRIPIVLFLVGWIHVISSSSPCAAEITKTEALATFGGLTTGQQAPWLAGWTTDGMVWNLNRALADSVTERLALVLWASWCKPCREGLLTLAAASERLREARVTVVLVGLDQDEAVGRRFLEKMPLPFTCILDAFGSATLTFLGIDEDGEAQSTSLTLPLTVVLDRQRTVLAIYGAEGADYIDLLLSRP